MFCGRCGAPIPANASFCPRCGNQVVVQTVEPVATMSTSVMPSRTSRWPTISVVGATAYLICVLLMFGVYWERQEDDWPSAFGYEIGTALIPVVIVLLYYYLKRKKNASTARIVTTLASWVLFMNLVSVGHEQPHLTTADIPVIAREAAGLAPITNQNDTGRTAVREYFKEVIAQNKDYQAKV